MGVTGTLSEVRRVVSLLRTLLASTHEPPSRL